MKTTPYPNWIIHPFKINGNTYRLTSTTCETNNTGNDHNTFDTFKNLDTGKLHTHSRFKWINSLRKNKLMQ